MIHKLKMKTALGLAAVAALSLPTLASASLVYNSSFSQQAQGFGNVPRHLSLQATGGGTVESGCVSATGGIISFGSCISDPAPATTALFFQSNGFQNTSGTAAMPNPLEDNQKYGIPSLDSLAINSANQIGIYFNATEPAGNTITVQDITLKFYDGGVLVGAIDTILNDPNNVFLLTAAGNGSAGFTFVVDGAQQDYVNGLIGSFGTDLVLALEATLQGGTFSGGPETFTVYNLNTPPIPEPSTYALMLAGLGVVGFMARRRRKG